MKNLTTVILATVAVAVFGISASAQGHKKIGMKRAQAIAASHAKGLPLKAKELEHENGKWIYSFEFKNRDGSTREVNVNAYTGKIVGIEHETAKSEADEEKGEKKTKH
ncbi:MAG: PepSY domain-containing protein [Acidobacteria bacterium]|nr:PepSY domain-containing protein [Acidobacteriota bacterium]